MVLPAAPRPQKILVNSQFLFVGTLQTPLKSMTYTENSSPYTGKAYALIYIKTSTDQLKFIKSKGMKTREIHSLVY